MPFKSVNVIDGTSNCASRGMIIHKESSDKIRQVCREKGIQVVEMKEAFRGSEDFGHYLKQTKGAICYIRNENYPHLHTVEYDFPNDIIETAVELFKVLAEV